MTKKFRNAIISLMAASVASLSMCVTGITASAAGPLRTPSSKCSFRVGTSYATGELYASINQANAYTSLSGADYVRATLTVHGNVSSVSYNNGVKVQGTYVSVNVLGSDITQADSNHYAEKGSSNGIASMTRTV